MAQELPKYFGGSFVVTGEALGAEFYWSYAFNKTFPTGYGGTAPNSLYPEAGYSNMIPELAELIRDNAPLAGVFRGCPDTCEAKLKAPALAEMACNSQLIPVNYTDIPYIKDNAIEDQKPPALNTDQFIISIGLVLGAEKESLNLVTAYPIYSDADYGVGHLNMTACTFDSAIGEYTVEIADGKATLVDAANPVIIALANNSAVDPVVSGGVRQSTLAPIVELGWERFETIEAVVRTSTGEYTSYANGQGIVTAREFRVPNWSNYYAYTDPRPYVVKNLNNMMVWAGEYINS